MKLLRMVFSPSSLISLYTIFLLRGYTLYGSSQNLQAAISERNSTEIFLLCCKSRNLAVVLQ